MRVLLAIWLLLVTFIYGCSLEPEHGPGIDRPFETVEDYQAAKEKFMNDIVKHHHVRFITTATSVADLKNNEAGWAPVYALTTYGKPFINDGDKGDGWISRFSILSSTLELDSLLIEHHGKKYEATIFMSNCADILYHSTPGIRPSIYDDYIKIPYYGTNPGLCLET